MVGRVRAEAERRGMPWVTAERLEAEDLRVPDASFDVVVCSLGITLTRPKAES